MFKNNEEEIYCPNCKRPYFRFAQMNSVFCICHITFVFSIDKTEIQRIEQSLKENQKVQVPKAFYDAFEQEKDF